MKKTIAAALILALSVAGYFAFERYNRWHFIEKLKPHVKNISLRVGNSALLEIEPSKITYKEIFERLETDISEVDKRLLEIQSLSSPKTDEITGPTAEYMRSSQNYLRTLLQKHRKQFELDMALERSEELTRDTSTIYGTDYSRRNLEQTLKKLSATGEEYKTSLADFVETIDKLNDSAKKVSSIYTSDVLISASQLEKVKVKNTTEKPTPEAVEKKPVPNERSINGKFVSNKNGGTLFIITGLVDNPSDISYSHIEVEGTLSTKKNLIAKTKKVFCGNYITDEMLKSGDIDEIMKLLQVKEGDSNSNENIKPGSAVTFMIVFSDLPEELQNFNVKVAGFDKATEGITAR